MQSYTSPGSRNMRAVCANAMQGASNLSWPATSPASPLRTVLQASQSCISVASKISWAIAFPFRCVGVNFLTCDSLSDAPKTLWAVSHPSQGGCDDRCNRLIPTGGDSLRMGQASPCDKPDDLPETLRITLTTVFGKPNGPMRHGHAGRTVCG